ncbi:C39 family peptidase [Luteolibacter arcticus]|uniref:C39 family peptidase n=1 Tax=Luteolibacter arcticus TaxID=1581411 RepID=A0ABT3GLZ9_9BACT|nr:C39 family peptidase [Luteolibacter arcticus]MCW1924538.1 C39 family peptidase [Luteolibacter arcticus]
MKRVLASLLLTGVLLESAVALPNSILGPVFAAESPLNGQDLTDQLFAAGVWDDAAGLPGEWNEEGQIATATISHLRARPKLFGHEVILLRSVTRGGKLESLEATFVDAGSFFGYFDEELPEGLSKRETRKEVEIRLAAKQTEFTKIYTDAHTDLRMAISSACGDAKPVEAKIGRTRGLKTPVEEWQKNGKHVRLLAANNRLLRVSIAATDADQWLDPAVAALPEREQLAKLAATVARDDDGTVRLPDLQPIPQGYRPYCGLNSLAMAARHFGLHLDEDWLAVAAGFQNTGRADGANMVKVYHAVASEAGLGLDRTTKFDASAASRAISQGFPVIVWRRFSHDRNQLHTRFMRQLSRDPAATLPDPAAAAERASWPGETAPLHASVVVGYNAERKEVLFLESWTGRDKPRRMRVEELAATTDLCFVFKP